jgi:hypothetical protein
VGTCARGSPMTTGAASPKSVTNRLALGAAVASGTIGIMAAACLIAADQLRAWRVASRPVVTLLFTSHDVGTIFQSLLLIPVICMVHALYGQRSPPVSFASAVVSVIALSAIALLQSLRLAGIGPDTLYMVPQGLLGLWLIIVNRRARNILPRHVALVGMVAGVGLTVIAASLLTVIGYFGLGALSGPIRASDASARLVNRIVHFNLDVGTFLGKPTYPIWVLLVAFTFHRNRFQPASSSRARPA